MKYLYILYQIIVSPLLLAITILTGLFTVLGCWLGDGHFWGYYPGKIWSRLFCYILLIPITVERNKNVLKNTSYVFVANHQGAFDIFLIYGFLNRNFKWMMKKSLRQAPIIGKASEVAGHIFVDKSGPKKILACIEHAYNTLKDGMSLVIFPEGSRSYTGQISEFKKGAFILADELQLPVVPLTISGSFNILPRTGKYLSWHPMKLIIHDPIYPIGKGPENLKHLSEESHKVIEASL